MVRHEISTVKELLELLMSVSASQGCGYESKPIIHTTFKARWALKSTVAWEKLRRKHLKEWWPTTVKKTFTTSF